ncbi:MAG: GH39 family glycosyl hydrolase [Polyangia bacterium]
MVAVGLVIAVVGCSSGGDHPAASGGSTGTGGTPSTGTGGTPGTGTGGRSTGDTGGSPNPGTGGVTGIAGSGGSSIAGASGTAGRTGAGGAPATGGISGGGGMTCAPAQSVGGNTACTPPTPPSAKDSVTLDMAAGQGAPAYHGSGFIYGISEDGTQPPTALLTAIKVRAFRAGRGVTGNCGQAAWDTHWKVIKGYYARAKELGVPLEILVSDDYQYSCPLPGDGGDWTTFTTFMTQLIDNVKANGMTGPDVRWELWNEADYSGFWKGTQAQWLDTWKHAYQQVRAAIPGAIIEGPSLSTGAGGSWMNAFLDFCKTNNVVPDYISWHDAGGGGDPVNDQATISKAVSTRGLTGVKGFDLNEYGSTGEQNPGHSAWFLARFDRAGIDGLRSNWAGGSEFFSNMGALVTTNWQPNSQYWIYRRYGDQTGTRIAVTAGTQVDAVAYQDACAGKSIVVVGNKGGTTGSVNVVIKNIPGWLQPGGSTKVLLERMPAGSAALSAPAVVSNAAATVTCNSTVVTINWTTATDGYVVTLTPP